MSGAIAPNPTLYINNLNDKVNKEELRAQLLALFISYGRVIDIVAKKGSKMKGQAFIAFADLAEATTAMRACEGTMFYDKPLVRCISQKYALLFLLLTFDEKHIHYAKTKSYALIKREDPDFVPPNPVGVSREQNGPSTSNGVEKRSREEDADTAARQVKREKPSGAEDGDEMELEDDNDEEPQQAAQCASLSAVLIHRVPVYKLSQNSYTASASTTNCAVIL